MDVIGGGVAGKHEAYENHFLAVEGTPFLWDIFDRAYLLVEGEIAQGFEVDGLHTVAEVVSGRRR